LPDLTPVSFGVRVNPEATNLKENIGLTKPDLTRMTLRDFLKFISQKIYTGNCNYENPHL